MAGMRTKTFSKACWLMLALALLISGMVLPSAASGTAEGYRPPGKSDKCPVCGMFAYKYPDWIAAIRLADNSIIYFDGAKDMFRHLLSMKPEERARIASIYATEYYGLEIIDARKAFYVTGGDVYGPMGRELIPFRTRAEAEEFKRDHKGRAILAFGEVTQAIMDNIDLAQ